jgi:hypothetical protein
VLPLVPLFGGWVVGDVGSVAVPHDVWSLVHGDTAPGVPAPGGVLPDPGALFGLRVEGLLLGAAVPGLGAAVPGEGVAVPGVGAAVPGAGAALPRVGFVFPGKVVWPGVALLPAVPAWPAADPALPEPALCATVQVAESSARHRTVAFAFI